jgi:FixJ family two-component response regulator
VSPTVFVVDDDEALRSALVQLLEAAGLVVASYPDGSSFLADYGEERPGCVLLDVAMPGMSGIELQSTLAERGLRPAIVFLTGHGDIPMAVRAACLDQDTKGTSGDGKCELEVRNTKRSFSRTSSVISTRRTAY